jgi:hypothetical protein
MKSLVCYCTKHGTTKEVAEHIAGKLGAELLDLASRGAGGKDLSAYDTVIVGGPVHMGAWAAKAKDFALRREAELARKRFAYFVVAFDTAAGVEPARSVLPAALAGAPALWAGGAFVWERLGPLTRLVAKAANGGRAGSVDHVDYAAVDAFAVKLGGAA